MEISHFEFKDIDERSKDNSSSYESSSNIFRSKENSNKEIKDETILKSKSIEMEIDPFRNTTNLKKKIERLNQTLFRNKGYQFSTGRSSQNEDLSKKEENIKIIEKILNTKNRMKIQNISKESKHNQKFKDFKNMDTFFDIRKFLKEINILEDREFKEYLSALKSNLKEIRIKNPMASEKIPFYEKIDPVLKHARDKINDFHSENPKSNAALSSLNSKILNYLIMEAEKKKIKEYFSEYEACSNTFKEELFNIPVLAKNEDETIKNKDFSSPIAENPEYLQDLDEIKRMLLKLGINLDQKKGEFFNTNSDLYFQKYKEKANKLRIYMDRLTKDIFKKKWIKTNQLNSYKNDDLDIPFHSQIISNNTINPVVLANPEKSSTFITAFDGNSGLNKSTSLQLSDNLQTKVKNKLQRLMNSNNIFPFIPNIFHEPQPLPKFKLLGSITNSNISNSIISSKKREVINPNKLSNVISTAEKTRIKSKTLHVKFDQEKVRKSIDEFNKVSNDALIEQRKSLRKSRKSVYSLIPLINPEINVDLTNIQKFNQMVESIQDRNQMVSKFQKFLSYVDHTKQDYEKKTVIYQEKIGDITDDLDLLKEKIEKPLIESIRDDIYTNQYIERRNKWFKNQKSKNLKNSIRIVLSQKR